jgi:hypothetical protein
VVRTVIQDESLLPCWLMCGVRLPPPACSPSLFLFLLASQCNPYSYMHTRTYTHTHTHHHHHHQIVLSTLAMALHLFAHWGGLEALAATHKLSEGVLALLATRVLPALVIYNATVNFPNVLRQSCLVVRCVVLGGAGGRGGGCWGVGDGSIDWKAG